MDKVSGIIPASTRQTWVTGEIAKPRRVSEPVSVPQGEDIPISSARDPEIPKPSAEMVSRNINEQPTLTSFKGGKLSRMA